MLRTILFILFIQLTLHSQFRNVKVNTKNNNPNEASISINPLNPLNLVAGANLSNYYWTTDGGNTWGEGELKSKDYGVWGDPCLIFDLKGNAYFFHLSRPTSSEWIDRIVVQKSTDGGATYNDPGFYTGHNPPKKQDKEWACVDFTNGERKNFIYATWTQFDNYKFFGALKPTDSSNIHFSFSSDAGETWSTAIRINEIAGDCLDSANTTEGAVPCVGPSGEVYVSWSGPVGIVFDRSTNGGMTWLDKDISVSPQAGGWEYDIEGIYRCNGMPITGCDISNSPYRGTIYINFSDTRNGEDDVDIFLCKSTDAGNTWSQPMRINDDKRGNKHQQFMSWMSVDPVTGAINILFYDRRNYDDNQTDVYLARSTDGGNNFVNVKISESPFTPKAGVFFGDYLNISSYNDFTACIWGRQDEGKPSVMFCGIDFKK